MVTAIAASPDMGFHARKTYYRSGMVVPSFLATEIFQRSIWIGSEWSRAAPGRHLCGGGYRQHWWGMALVHAPPEGVRPESRAQDRYAGVRVMCGTDDLCRAISQSVGDCGD